MRLSGAVIVRDEQHTLARCLNSLKDLVDELVVVDTGSKDDSPQIAESLGATVRHFVWNDDFSAARNFALSQLTGDWVVFLDADEYIDTSRVWLRHALEQESSDSLLCGLYNLSNDGNTVYNHSSVIRVFRRDRPIVYVRSIHEHLVNGTSPITHADCCNWIRVYHTGYSPEAVAAKSKYSRNRTLLLRELWRDPKSSDLHYYLAETYLLGHEMMRAIHSFEQALHIDRFVHVGVYWVRMRYLLAMVKSGGYTASQLLDAVGREQARYPESPELWAYKGMILADAERFDESRECLAKGQELASRGQGDNDLFENIKDEVMRAFAHEAAPR